MSNQETESGASTPASIREMLEALDIPVPEIGLQNLGTTLPENQWRHARSFVTDEVARNLWLEWNPDQSRRTEDAVFFKEFLNMLREGVSLGFKLERFRDVSRKLPQPGGEYRKWITCFEDAISGTDTVCSRVYLSRDQYQSFKRGHPDGAEKGDTWDQMLRTMSEGLFYELGLTLPPISVLADDSLSGSDFRCEWNDLRLPTRKGLADGRVLVNDTVERLRLLNIDGETAINPANGAVIATVDAAYQEVCEQAGLTTWDSKGYVILAISSAFRKAAASFVNRSLVDLYLFRLSEFNQELIELIDQMIDRDYLVQILRGLLAEQISIRNLPAILNHLLLSGPTFTMPDMSRYIVFAVSSFTHVKAGTKPEDIRPRDHIESVRSSLKRYISHKYTRGSNTLIVYLMDPQAEGRLSQPALLNDSERKTLIMEVHREIGSLPPPAQAPVILTTYEVRHRLWEILHLEFDELAVLSYQELSPDMNIQPIARISPELQPYDEGFYRLIESLPVFSEPHSERRGESVPPGSDPDQFLATFLNDRRARLVSSVKSRIIRDHPHLEPPLKNSLERLLERIFEGYLDLLANGQTDTLDSLSRALSGALAAKDTRLSGIFGMPLVMAEEVRRMLAEEYAGLKEENATQKFNQVLEKTETIAYQAAWRIIKNRIGSQFGRQIS
jgi:hypothetical protein